MNNGMKNRLFRVSAFLLVLILSGTVTFYGMAATEPKKTETDSIYASAEEITGEEAWQKGPLTMTVDGSDGFITVKDSRSGMEYTSTPSDYENDRVAEGINNTRMASQLIVSFLDADKSWDETNSFAGSVMEDALIVKKSGDTLILEYGFPEFGFVIPVLFRLTETSLAVTIDYSHIKENTECRIVNIALLPYFGAARSGDKGYYILPDGSGAYVEFNNGQYAQGEYSRVIYGGDLTKTSESKSGNEQAVLLPLFAAVFTHVTPPEAPRAWDEEPLPLAEGREVKAGFLATINNGAAAAEIITAIAGGSTGYNTSSFRFLYRSFMDVAFLDRTWAETKSTMLSEEPCMSGSPEVEYRLLDDGEAGIKEIAGLYAAMLLGEETERKAKPNTLFLDIYSSVRASRQFLGFAYQDTVALTTLAQTDTMLTELKAKGVEDFAVMLRGLDSSGAYFGRIDTSLSVTKKLGGMKALQSLIDTWGAVYPEVSLTQFSRNGNGIRSFFDSVTAVNKKTAKQYDYNFATGLRDYKKSVRYLLKPGRTEEAAEALAGDLDKKSIQTVAPVSLARDLYSNFGGGQDQIGDVEKRFAAAVKQLANGRQLMLERPNAYAIPYAKQILYLPDRDSGHFISNGSIPFVQLVLDGLKEYSVPPINYASNPEEAFLRAVESNSSLSFVLMEEEYDKVARTTEAGLFASAYARWKQEIISCYERLARVREKTEGTPVAAYEILAEGIRRVTFENGVSLIVNYNEQTCMADNITVPAISYQFTGD